MLDADAGAKTVEVVVVGGGMAAQAEKPIGELLAVGEHAGDARLCSPLENEQKAAGACRRNREPTRRPVNGYEEVAAALRVGHLGQAFNVDM